MSKLPTSLALSLILLIAGGVGYGVWRVEREDAQNQPSLIVEVRHPERIALPPLASLPIFPKSKYLVSAEGWQTYRNGELGFEVKYPRGLVVKPHFGSTGGGLFFYNNPGALDNTLLIGVSKDSSLQKSLKNTIKDYS